MHDIYQDKKVDPLRAYLGVFVALMALLILTVGVYYIPFEDLSVGGVNLGWLNTAIALAIAITKALLVMIVFMHLQHSSKLTWAVAGAGFVFLIIMMTFFFTDYQSRGMIPEAMRVPVSHIHAIPLEH
jgi:cytochrome c oxidase subunit 4